MKAQPTQYLGNTQTINPSESALEVSGLEEDSYDSEIDCIEV